MGFEEVSTPAKSALYVWGYNDCGQTARSGRRRYVRIPKSLKDFFKDIRWLDIACGREHTAAVTSDGSLFTWGCNGYGQLGDGSEQDSKSPKKVDAFKTEFVKSVACGAHCTAAIAKPRDKNNVTSSSRLWVWGQNQGSNYPRLFWGAFSPNTEAEHLCSTRHNGDSELNQLVKQSWYHQEITYLIITQVACGATHVAAKSEEGALQTWGYNEYGQLGRGFSCEGLQGARIVNAFLKFLDEAPENVKVTQVACGEYHTAVIADNGDVYTWGLGYMGQLGHRSLQYGNKELLPRRVVGLEGIAVKDIACGGIHTCALTDNGALYAWGGGQAGQLGLGPPNGFLSCIANDAEMFLRNIPILVLPMGVHLVTCGHSHTLVSMKDGRILGWGYNSYGQAATDKITYAWYPSPVDWCIGEVHRLAAGGGHSAVLTHAYSLKELCEFKLADNVTLSSAPEIEEIASRTGSDALARLCERLREQKLNGSDHANDDEEDGHDRSLKKPNR